MHSIRNTTSTATLLVPTVVVNGIGWVAALFLLGIGRMVGRHGLFTIGAGVVLAIVAGVLWPNTLTSMVAFVALPLTIAALQITASIWNTEPTNGERTVVANNGNVHANLNRGQRLNPPIDADERSGGSWTEEFQTEQSINHGSATEACAVNPTDDRSNRIGSDAAEEDDSKSDFSSSSLLSIALALAIASVSNDAMAQIIYSQPDALRAGIQTETDSNVDGVDEPTNQQPVEVLVPLRKDGTVLGDKIYLPETFYNELFFEEIGPKVHEVLIHRADYRLRLRSANSLDFGIQDQASAVLTVDLAFRRPASLPPQSASDVASRNKSQRKVRLPYRAGDVEDIQSIAAASEPSVFSSSRNVRYGRDDDGWLWVEMPDTEIVELQLTLRCASEVQQPWVILQAELPPLAVSTLTVQAERRVSSVVLHGPPDSTNGLVVGSSTPIPSQLIPTDLPSVVDPFAYDSRKIDLGNATQLNMRFRVDEPSSPVMPWNNPEQWSTRYWVYAQPGETVVECELEPQVDLPPQTSVKVFLNNENVELLSEGWQISPYSETSYSESKVETAADQANARESQAVPHVELVRHAGRSRPIRLGWKISTDANAEFTTLSLPRVQVGEMKSPEEFMSSEPSFLNATDARDREIAATATLPWIAFSFSKEIQPDWSRVDGEDASSVQPLAIDKFYSLWSGYLKSIQRAMTGDIRELTYQTIPPPQGQWLTRHDILIDSLEQRIKYIAEVKPPVGANESDDQRQLRYSIELPPRARLLDWRYASAGDEPISPSYSVDDIDEVVTSEISARKPITEKSWEIVRQGNTTRLFFDAPMRGFVIEIDAVLPNASQGKGKNTKPATRESVRLGHVKLDRVSQPTRSANTDDLEQIHDFQITRNKDLKLQWVRRSDAERVLEGHEDAAALLTAGEVLVDRFTIAEPIHDSTDLATYRVRPINVPFDLDSRITLRWEEGRWMAQMDCQITSNHIPDFIDVAIPTRWCDSLQVEPLCVSSRQPTLDPALQVMRIELRPVVPETEAVKTFRLKSRLAVSEIARVTVPEIDVLNARRHRIDVVVPTRLTNEQVRWRSNFAGPIEKPRWSVESPMRMPEDSALSVYAVAAPTWSIDLETLPRTDRRAKILHADHKVVVCPNHLDVPGSQVTYIISRFDVLPGDQSSVRLNLDRSATLIGLWAATQAADLQRVPSNVAANQRADSSDVDQVRANSVRYDIPLPLNRLSQTIEVVTTTDRPFAHNESWLLPRLEGLSNQDSPATVAWCEKNDALPAFNSLNATTELMDFPLTPADRAQLLASSVVRAIASSSDALADRRDEEVATWLLPWISRYRMLASSVGRELGDDQAGELMDGDTAEATDSPDAPPEQEASNSSTSSDLAQIDLDDDGVLPWPSMDRFILNQEVRYFSTDDDFLASNDDRILRRLDVRRASMWTDFLSVSNPPGYSDRWTFLWSEPTLPVAELGRHRSVMAETTRQNVLRVGLFLVLAAFLFVSSVMPKNERSRPVDDVATETDSRTAEGNLGDRIVKHPAFWLTMLAIIGLPIVPIPLSVGLLLVTAVLVGIDPGYSAISRWRKT